MNNTKETLKFKCINLQYKVNEEKGIVTAVEKFMIPTPEFRTFTTIGVAKVNKEAGDVFNVETGKKLARAKAEKEAFIQFKSKVLYTKEKTERYLQKINNTIEKMNANIQHQKEYIASF